MQYDKFELSNGTRVIVVKRQQQPFVTVRVFVKAGSRHDNNNPGLAHLVEHLLFRNKDSISADDIYCKIESLGGKVDGNTTKEYSDYSLVILKENLIKGLQLFSDILTYPRFTDEGIEDEKEIIIEEIVNSYSRSKILWDVFAQSIWKESHLRNPIWGSVDSIKDITLKDVVGFYEKYYTADNMVVVFIGDIEYNAIEKTIEKMFARIKRESISEGTQFIPHVFNKTKTVQVEKNSIQTQLIVGFPGVAIKNPHLSTFKIMNKIVGHGMSSRLYKTLRVKLHLVYSLSSVLAIYEDTGYFAVWTNYNSMKSGLILEAILEEFDRLKKEIVTEEELSHAKIRYKRDLLHNFETNFSFAGFLGISELLTGEIETFEDILSKIGLVKDKDLFDLANKYFLDEDLLTVLLGKDKLSEDTKK